MIFSVTLVFVLSVLNLGLASAKGATQPPTPTSSCPKLDLPTPICHVVIIVLENQNASWVLKHGPFERQLAKKYAFAAQYYSIEHFSIPNYFAITSGMVNNSVALMHQKNVVDLLFHSPHNMTWRAYMEDMPTPCNHTTAPGYRSPHNPFVWYADIRNHSASCRHHDVNLTHYATDVSSRHLPNYALIAPNVTHSCWKLGVVVCDAWLQTFVSPMVNNSYFKSSVVFVTYDEGPVADLSGINGTPGGGRVYTVAISPFACPGYTSSHQYNHFNLLTTTEWLLDLNRTGTNDSWSAHPPMYDLFCFPNGTNGTALGRPCVTGTTPAPPLASFVLARAREVESLG